jgi:hypothetical protein
MLSSSPRHVELELRVSGANNQATRDKVSSSALGLIDAVAVLFHLGLGIHKKKKVVLFLLRLRDLFMIFLGFLGLLDLP